MWRRRKQAGSWLTEGFAPPRGKGLGLAENRPENTASAAWQPAAEIIETMPFAPEARPGRIFLGAVR